MYDVITVGSAVVDIFIESTTFKIEKHQDQLYLCQLYGEKNEIDSFELQPGGGGGNTAVGFARMGFKTGLVSETGKDTLSDVLVSNFHAEYVATNLLVQEKLEQTGGSVILLGQGGKRSILVYRGAASMLDPHDIPTSQLKRAKWVHVASVGGRTAALKKVFAARADNRKLSWNPGSAELKLINAGDLQFSKVPCDVLQLNAQEWDSIEQFQKNAIAHIPYIIITDGAKGGMVFVKGQETVKYKQHPSKLVDATGAGDSFVVGFVSALLKDKSVEQATMWGAQNAASVVSQRGAKPGLLHSSDIK